jgi:hypothetical protein
VIAALLQEERRIVHKFPDQGGHVTIGRSPYGDLYIDDTRISREHAYVERLPDRIVVRARKRLRVDGIDVTEAVLRPGDRFELRGVVFVALTAAMASAYRNLDRLVGDPRAVHDLLTMPRDKHAVLLGVQDAPLYEIARSQHAALTGPDARLVEASIGTSSDPRVPDVEALLPAAVNGRIFIDGRKRDAKGRVFAPRLAQPLMERLARPEQRTALTLALHDLSDVSTNVLRRGCVHFLIPPITDRLTSTPFNRAHLIDTTFEEAKSSLRTRHLHPDFIAALVDCPWTGDYKAFRAVLYFAICVWRDKPKEAAELETLYRRRLTPWLREADLSWERLRELPPDERDTQRRSRPDTV